MMRTMLATGLLTLLLTLAGCNCGPNGQGSTTCTYGVDPPRCYTCPSAAAASTCATAGPSEAGCSTTAISCS
jgi:hypothetical protein